MSVMSNVEARFCRSAPWRGFARRVVLPWATRDVSLTGRVLEIGGGSGAMAFELLRREPNIHLTLADLDPMMVTAAQARLRPFAERASAVQGDATALDLPDDSFDTVCTWLMLHHTIQWQSVLAAARRVLRPGGSIVGYDLTDSAAARMIHRVDGSEHRLIQPGELETELKSQEFEAPRVISGLGGLVVKFAATTGCRSSSRNPATC